jgi:two-component system alkaline phosphatase synthesis response regulator PhoP
MTRQILIADDEAHIRLLIEQALEDLEDQDVDILTARDGAEAVDMIRDNRPEVVFLDVMMPRMDGFEVCRTVKHDLGLDEIYVVLLTAKGQVVDREVGEQSGADLYLTKPFDPDHLLAIAQRALEERS